MNDLIFSLNATMPIFILMVLGYILKKIKWMDEDFANKMNNFVFKLPLPVLLFSQLSSTNFIQSWDTRFVLFCFAVTLVSIMLVSLISLFLKKGDRGEFIQASYRSSAALLGIAYIQNIYGEAKMAPLMIIGAVPLYNIMAVVVLSFSHHRLDKRQIQKTLLGIIKNPIIIGILLGFLASLIHLPIPTIADKVLTHIGRLATPLGLMAMGGSIDFKKVGGQLKNAFIATFIKLCGLEIIWLPLAIMMGFTTQKLIAIVIMLGSATTVSSFVMAKNMGHEGTLTSNTVVLTTILSSFTLTFWIYIIKILGLL